MYNGVERYADNVGGKTELKRLFDQELIYPEKALLGNLGGKVIMKFTVLDNGSVNNFVVAQKVSQEIDAEAVRIFRKLIFLPAIYRGKTISSDHFIEFDFNPKKYRKLCKARGYTSMVYPVVPDTALVIYEKPSTMPAYPEGDFGLQEFIQKNLDYPRQAQLQNLKGTVIVSLVVEPHGMASNIYVEQFVGGGCNEEALRVIRMIKWIPGTRNGKGVRVRIKVPITFELRNSYKDNVQPMQK